MGEVEARAEPGAEAVEAGERGAASARPEAGDPGWREAVAAVAVRVARAFQRDRVLLHASALTYVTLLSLVPVLALAFAILTGLGVPRRLEPWIMGRISAGSEEIAQRILAYIDNIKVGSLGTVGVIGLLVTVVLVMGNIERAFNHIWGVDRPRRWSRKFADFLSVVLVFPFLILAASSLNAFLSHAPPPAVGGAARHLWVVTGRAILHAAPHLFVIAALTFLYIFMPNTRVRPSAALAGGVIAGVVLEVAQSLYLHFQIGAAKYNAIYGAMAQLPVFLVWIYLSWVVTLLGAEVAWAVQLEQGRRRVEAGWLPPASTLEWLHLELLRLVVQRYEAGEGASSAAGVAAATGLPEAACRGILEGLTDAGLLLSDGAEPAGYVPAEPPERVSVYAARAALRRHLPEGLARLEPHLAHVVAEPEGLAALRTTFADLLPEREPEV